MALVDDVAVTRRMCPVIFLMDTSGSMRGEPIGAVNAALESILPLLKDMNDQNADVEIQIGVLTFSFGAEWKTGENLVSPEAYVWRDLDANGPTELGAAYNELNKKLSTKSGFMKRASGSVAPVLFLLSDGAPTDEEIVPGALQRLKENNWYKVAAKVAIGYGEYDEDVLVDFTGNRETVLSTTDPNELKKMIRFVTITSSMVASSGKGAISNTDNHINPDDNTAKVADALQENQGDLGNADMDPDEDF